jgi:hypothetical protein
MDDHQGLNMKLTHATALLIMLITSSLSMASPLNEDLQQLRLSVTDAMTSFYMYNGLEADMKYAARIDRDMTTAFDALTRITESNHSDEEQAFVRSLLSGWNTFSTLMGESRNDIVTKGYPNIRLVDDMGTACLSITQDATRLYGIAARASNPTLDDVVRMSDNLSFQMAEITAQYTGRGTSNVGQVFVGYNKSTPKEMAEKFDKQLNELDQVVRPEDTLNISGIRNKWAFLSRSISNYNENSVPFLVVTYNDRIIEKLSQLAEQYRE